MTFLFLLRSIQSGNDDYLTPIQFNLTYNILQDRNNLRAKLFMLEASFPMINTTVEERTKQFQVEAMATRARPMRRTFHASSVRSV